MSLDCISHWNDTNFKNIGFNQIRTILQDEIKGFRQQLVAFRRAMPTSKFVYILGNHEDWLTQFCQKYPQMSDMRIEKVLDLASLDIDLVPFGGYYKYGKLNLTHGHQFGTENPAKQALMRTHKSVAFGHHHGEIIWSDFSDIDEKEKHVGILVPCYAGLAPGYNKGRPNRWVNGFLEVQYDKNGYFFPFIQHVKQDGTFITQSGKVYA